MSDIFDDFPIINPEDFGIDIDKNGVCGEGSGEVSVNKAEAFSPHQSAKLTASPPGGSQTDVSSNDGAVKEAEAFSSHRSADNKDLPGGSHALNCCESGSDVEVVSPDEAEIMKDYPDSSEDIDINPVHKRVVDYFLVCGNKKKAAKLAGIESSSDEGLRVQACRIFKRPEVKAYYSLKKSELAEKADISHDAFMSELVSIATFDIKDAINTEIVPSLTNETVYRVHFKSIEDIPEYARKAVKAIEIAKDGTPKMIFYDKLIALKMLGEIKGYMSPRADDGDEEESGVAFIPSVIPRGDADE